MCQFIELTCQFVQANRREWPVRSAFGGLPFADVSNEVERTARFEGTALLGVVGDPRGRARHAGTAAPDKHRSRADMTKPSPAFPFAAVSTGATDEEPAFSGLTVLSVPRG